MKKSQPSVALDIAKAAVSVMAGIASYTVGYVPASSPGNTNDKFACSLSPGPWLRAVHVASGSHNADIELLMSSIADAVCRLVKVAVGTATRVVRNHSIDTLAAY